MTWWRRRLRFAHNRPGAEAGLELFIPPAGWGRPPEVGAIGGLSVRFLADRDQDGLQMEKIRSGSKPSEYYSPVHPVGYATYYTWMYGRLGVDKVNPGRRAFFPLREEKVGGAGSRGGEV